MQITEDFLISEKVGKEEKSYCNAFLLCFYKKVFVPIGIFSDVLQGRHYHQGNQGSCLG
jgi:hypothetical protein